MSDHRPFIDAVLTYHPAPTDAPDGLEWAVKSVRADLTTYQRYQWPLPGNWVEADAVDDSNIGACPSRQGDGLCVATTTAGMASGGMPMRTMLLVGYRPEDVLGRNERYGKWRVRRAYVGGLIDGEHLSRANLSGADLSRADLSDAYLSGWERGPDGYAQRKEVSA